MYADVVSRIATDIETRCESARPASAAPESSRLAIPGDWDFSCGDIARARSEAKALADDSHHGRAVEVLNAVVAPASRALGSLDDEVLALRLHLAEVLFEGGDYRRAAPAFGELHRDLAIRHSLHDEGVFHCRRQEATCQALMGQTGTALRMLTGLLLDEQGVYGEDDPRTFELRRQVGLLELGAGDIDRARRTLSGLLDDLIRLYGQEHPETVRVRDSLARLSM